MTSRVRGSRTGGALPTGGAEGGAGLGSIRDQVEDSLFGRKKRASVAPDDDTEEALARLDVYRKKLARLAQTSENDYRLVLVDGAVVTIALDGEIAVGAELLEHWADDLEAQVGALAHEIGHQPQRWAEVHGKSEMTKEQGEELCRVEEMRADMFTGFALSQLELRWEPFYAYVEATWEQHPHRIYFPIEVRRETLRQAHESGLRRSTNMKKLFPEFARTLAKYDLGEG